MADSALTYFQSSLRLTEQSGGPVPAILYNNLGLVYFDLNMPDSASWFLNKSLNISNDRPDLLTTANSYLTLGLIAQSRHVELRHSAGFSWYRHNI